MFVPSKDSLDFATLASITRQHSSISSTRDVFQGRLDSFRLNLANKYKNKTNEISLFTAVLGEIGNNSFDHNLGKWSDVVGCFFETVEENGLLTAVIMDRGQGILKSLQPVAPDLKTSTQALNTAFEKILSGRSPEKRGNGLKFVRQVINGSPQKGLLCLSGDGHVFFGGMTKTLESLIPSLQNVIGVLTIVQWQL